MSNIRHYGDVSEAVLRDEAASSHHLPAPTTSSSNEGPRRESEVLLRAKQKADELHKAFEEVRKTKGDLSAAVPGSDREVKNKLRLIGEPICLFGEDPADRRGRLKLLLSKGKYQELLKPAAAAAAKEASRGDDKRGKVEQELFFTIGSENLMAKRRKLWDITRQKSKKVLEAEREDFHKTIDYDYNRRFTVLADALKSAHSIEEFTGAGSDTRPLSCIRLSRATRGADPHAQAPRVAVASWSGYIGIWTADEKMKRLYTLGSDGHGHSDRCQTVAWSPNGRQLASGGADHNICIWDLPTADVDTNIDEPLSLQPSAVLEGHEMRVNNVEYVPVFPQLVASTSHDDTWRLWDIEKQEEILLQEGHNHPVFGLAIHPCGSLIATSDMSGVVRVWDLRTGRTVLPLTYEDGGHCKGVLAVDFSPNGFQLATGGMDNSVKLWDLRKRRRLENLPAHEKLISDVRFSPDGRLLLTAGYDGVAKIWSTLDWTDVRNLPIACNKVMSADIDGSVVATAGFDRQFKIWKLPSENVKEDDKDVEMKTQ
ncbi:wd-repeat protein, putative [Perkinsus marinus ATCC 50983]|uniref:Wd-repeat protein, putative n=1 Tax=Perkinsus marinus (strain ATCC 50983 / TXsc) TaxID=423536 RepID=C5LD25_PERM5|nr:wd-repeat protein, putative [Perkinsus marinus ATCC 50983]EER05369.1 wd-repeat protein, putative [Perkinsus marinus ATCC 50983]|eukprot:XP_002773553.1 wd-repeat protein, putative [Perkinsus marinus ATCC 50983]